MHRSKLDAKASAALQFVRDQLGQYVYPVHRLDRPASGVLLFALSPEAARRLGQAFQERRVAKTYLAAVAFVRVGGVIQSTAALLVR